MMPIRRTFSASNESGSILVFVAISMAVLIGFVGLVIDVGQLYVAKQRAQAAADSGALAALIPLNQAYTSHNVQFVVQALQAAQTYGRFNAPNASINPSLFTSTSCPGSWCSNVVLASNTGGNVATGIEVKATITVNTTFLRVLGITSSTVSAKADAAVVLGPKRISMVMMSPGQSGSLTVNGGAYLQVCGGSATPLNVNSTSASSINNSGTIDLTNAGPSDPGNCSSSGGSGVTLDNAGPQASSGSVLGNYTYAPSAAAAPNPLTNVSEVIPGSQPAAPASQNFPGSNAYYNCPMTCTVMFPGDYPSGILVPAGSFVVFAPGVYFLDTGGFQVAAGAIVRSATSAAPDPNTGSGMLIFNYGATANDVLNIAAGSGVISGNLWSTSDCPNGGNCLTGSDTTSTYSGILFFQSKGPQLTLTHTVYATNPTRLSGSLYFYTDIGAGYSSTLNWTGPPANSCAGVSTAGPIIGDMISINGCLQVNLGQQLFQVPGVALVN
jgi:Flp pilus assembly protein TadG